MDYSHSVQNLFVVVVVVVDPDLAAVQSFAVVAVLAVAQSFAGIAVALPVVAALAAAHS